MIVPFDFRPELFKKNGRSKTNLSDFPELVDIAEILHPSHSRLVPNQIGLGNDMNGDIAEMSGAPVYPSLGEFDSRDRRHQIDANRRHAQLNDVPGFDKIFLRKAEAGETEIGQDLDDFFSVFRGTVEKNL